MPTVTPTVWQVDAENSSLRYALGSKDGEGQLLGTGMKSDVRCQTGISVDGIYAASASRMAYR